MQNKIFETFEQAVKDIPDGSSILIAGFGPGTPHNIIRALYFQGAKDLTIISNGAGGGGGGGREGMIGTGSIIEEGRVKKVILAFTAATHPSRQSPLERLHEAGEIDAELTPQGTLAERIRCGGVGVPAFYTPASVNTELAAGKEHRDFKGKTYVMEEAITADYAFIRCWKADEFGNLIFRRAQRNFNPIMAMAAECTIVEAEEIVPVGELDPDHVHTSGIYVQRLVKIPPPPEGILHASLQQIAMPAREPAPAASSS